MRKTYVILGILVFLAIATSPIWMNLGGVRAAEGPEISLDTPAIQAMDEKACIYDTEFMRDNHMEILHDWKVQVVREGNRTLVTPDGETYEMSLQNTCMECHSNYEDFCQSCHEFSGVEPNCWQCHTNEATEYGAGGAA